MRCQKMEPQDIKVLKKKGFAVAADGESAEYVHEGDGDVWGPLKVAIIRPYDSDDLLLSIDFPNGTSIYGKATNLNEDEHWDDEDQHEEDDAA